MFELTRELKRLSAASFEFIRVLEPCIPAIIPALFVSVPLTVILSPYILTSPLAKILPLITTFPCESVIKALYLSALYW